MDYQEAFADGNSMLNGDYHPNTIQYIILLLNSWALNPW